VFAKYENFFQEPIKAFKVYAQDFLNVVKHHVEFPIGSSRFLSIVNLLVCRRFYYYYIITYVSVTASTSMASSRYTPRNRKLKTAGHVFHADFEVTRFLFFWDLTIVMNIFYYNIYNIKQTQRQQSCVSPAVSIPTAFKRVCFLASWYTLSAFKYIIARCA